MVHFHSLQEPFRSTCSPDLRLFAECCLISLSPYLSFALAFDLGNITSTKAPIVWSLGVVRNPVVSYLTGSGQVQPRAPYFLTKYNNVQDAVSLLSK